MADDDEDFVLVLYDGSVRELAPDEKDDVIAKYSVGDSGRPYIKSSYEERNAWGSLTGYLPRRLVPPNVPIGKAVLLGGKEVL